MEFTAELALHDVFYAERCPDGSEFLACGSKGQEIACQFMPTIAGVSERLEPSCLGTAVGMLRIEQIVANLRGCDGRLGCTWDWHRDGKRQNDQVEQLAANTPSYAAGSYRESAPTPGSLSGSWPNSTIESPSASLTMHSGNSRMRRCFNAAFDVLPHRSQITRGGGPSRSTIFAKSASFVMTAAPAARAAAKIGGSRASHSPRSRTEAHSTAKVSAIHRAIDGER